MSQKCPRYAKTTYSRLGAAEIINFYFMIKYFVQLK